MVCAYVYKFLNHYMITSYRNIPCYQIVGGSLETPTYPFTKDKSQLAHTLFNTYA